MENELDTPQSENVEEQVDAVEPQVEETNEELEKAKKAFNDQKIRAEKAEKKLKALEANKPKENEEAPKNTSGLSNDDILALADIKDKDDRKFLIEKSKELGKSIEDLQADPYMQAALRTMSEERATAQATNTGKGKRGLKETTPEAVVQAANSGKDIDPAQLAEAQFALRRKRTE